MSEPAAFDHRNAFAIEGRSALVTGAAHGIGQAIATAFADCGAAVAMVDRDGPALERASSDVAKHGRVVAVTADVRDDGAVEHAVATAVAEGGGLDIVVNTAGIFPVIPFADTSATALLDILDVNVAGSARVARAALPPLRRGGRGRIINFASVMSFTGIPTGKAAYVASKSALVGLTRALAREWGPFDVTVNAIAPGAIRSRDEPAGGAELRALDEMILAKQSLQRRGTGHDIAAAAVFLASDAAAFITGQTLLVDGGWAFT